MTTAFLGLLAKGSEDIQGYWSSVINITSISGILKIAQNHVRLTMFLLHRLYLIQPYIKFCYNSVKAAASHLTRLLSTEIGLKSIPVRVNAIAPGAYDTDMSPVDEPFKLPIPAKRAGT